MAKHNLTARFIEALPNAAIGSSKIYYDSNPRGFGVRVTGTGYKGFILVYGIGGKEYRMPLGEYTPGCGALEIARKRARKLRDQVDAGSNPYAEIAHKKIADEEARRAEKERIAREAAGRDAARELEAKKLTFDQLADEYIAQHASKKKSGKADARRIDRYLRPAWGSLKAEAVTKDHVKRLLDPIRKAGKMAELQHVRSMVSGIFNFALGDDIVAANPCASLPKRKGDAVKPRTRALKSEKELRLLWAVTDPTRRKTRMPTEIAEALRLMLLTGCRPGEASGIRWNEIDFERAEWNKPDNDPGRSKSGRADVLPLVPAALAMLRARQGNGSPFVWPSGRSKRVANGGGASRLTPNKLAEGLRGVMPLAARLGVEPFHPHDVRATVATWMGMLQVRSHIIERVLNHARRGVTDIHYNMHEYVPEKREALERWTTNLYGIVGATKPRSRVSRIAGRKA